MLITTHVASGALVGRLTRRPAAALVLGVVSHLALDRVPHWGRPGTGGPPPGMDAEALRVARVDGLTGLAVIAALVAATSRRHRPAVLAGVVGACLPDLDKPSELFFGRSPYPAWFDDRHARLQAGREFPHHLRRDAAVALAGAVAVVAALRRDPRA